MKGPTEGVLPHNTEAEQNVIACLLIDPDLVSDVVPVLRPDDFYDQKMALIYGAIIELFKNGQDIDVVTILDQLEQQNQAGLVGGRDILVTMADSIGTTANLHSYVAMVRDYSLMRKMIQAAREIAVTGTTKSMTAEEYLSHAEQKILQVRTDAMDRRDIGIPIDKIVAEMSTTHVAGQVQPLLSTHIPGLDYLIKGLYRQEVTIIAARPSVGKTLIGTWLAYQIASQDRYPVLFASAEMSAKAITYRIVQAFHAQISRQDFNRSTWESDIRYVSKLPIRIMDAGHLTPEKIRAAALSYRSTIGDPPVIVVDYLQLLSTSNKYRSLYEKATEISAGIKHIAKDLDTPIVLLAQLNRQTESRPDKRPQLHDLRDSGTIEQDADNVILLYRPQHHIPDAPDIQPMELIVAKARNHKTGVTVVDVDLKWQNVVI